MVATGIVKININFFCTCSLEIGRPSITHVSYFRSNSHGKNPTTFSSV